MKPIYIAQRDQTDCGVACMLSIIQMHGGNAALETLREQSDTSITGTSLLGLQQAAEKQNMEAEAFEVDELEAFRKEATFPCILHVVIDGKLEHYVICYKVTKSSSPASNDFVYEMIDPGKGLETWTEEELLDRWRSKAVLLLKPKERFEKTELNRNRKWLWFQNLIEEDKPLLYIATAFGIGIAVLGMATAIFSQKLIDVILPNKDYAKLWIGIAVLSLLLLARGGLSYLRTFFLLRQSKDFNIRLLNDSYGKLLHLPYAFFDTRKIGDIIARLNDSRRIQGAISYLIGNVVIDFLVLMVSVAFVFSYSWQIALLVFAAIPLYGWLVWKFHARILSQQKEVMAQYASSESHFVDAVGGISAIKTNNKESFFHQIGNAIYTLFQEKIYALGTLSNRYGLWSELFNAILISLVLAYSSWMVLNNTLKLGEMMAVLSISMGMIGAIARLAFTNVQLQEARVAFDRMFEFTGLKAEIEMEEGEMTSNPDAIFSISMSNISFRFAGKKPLFENVNLDLKKGKVSVLMGEVGSGKTVLVNILQKFKEWDNGEVIINGDTNLRVIPSQHWRSKIGVVSQEAKIFSGTLLDNISLGNFMEEAENVVDFCRKYGFDKYFEALPQNYLTIVGEEGVNLSGGQKQLVNLARALYHNPEILLLDEPTSAMDYQTEQFVLELIRTIKHEKIILMVSHRISYEEFADEVIRMELGRFRESVNLI